MLRFRLISVVNIRFVFEKVRLLSLVEDVVKAFIVNLQIEFVADLSDVQKVVADFKFVVKQSALRLVLVNQTTVFVKPFFAREVGVFKL